MSAHDHHMMGMTTPDPHMHHNMNMSGNMTTTPHMHVHPTTMNHDGHGGHGGAAGDHSMKMYFHFDQNATILFEFWKTTSVAGIVGSCIGIFVLAVLYEGLKVLRESLLRRSMVAVRYNTMQVSNSQDTMITETHKTVGARMLSAAHVIQSLLHMLQIVVSYFLMLIFMTYNVWLCIAVALGAGTGYFLFAWKRAVVVDVNEHCH